MRKLASIYASMAITVGFGYFFDWAFRSYNLEIVNSFQEPTYLIIPGSMLMISAMLIFINLTQLSLDHGAANPLRAFLKVFLINILFWPGFELVFRLALDTLRK
jgi:hypothetical protein